MARGAIFYSILVTIAIAAILATLALALEPNEIDSPHDRIKENQIHIYPDRIVIDVNNAVWASYADTNSMDPIIDIGANGLEIIPESEDDLFIGDIAAYESKITNELVVHRIVKIKEDSQGKIFKFKGDNNLLEDPEDVRFSQIKYVLIGIIY